MSYFDGRVGECPVWQVVSISIVKVGIKVDMKELVVGAKISQFSAEGWVNEYAIAFWPFCSKNKKFAGQLCTRRII